MLFQKRYNSIVSQLSKVVKPIVDDLNPHNSVVRKLLPLLNSVYLYLVHIVVQASKNARAVGACPITRVAFRLARVAEELNSFYVLDAKNVAKAAFIIFFA